MLIDDENDLRAGLRALGAGTPPQPGARAEAAVRQAGRIRRRRAAAMSVAVLLPAVVVGTRLALPAPEPDRPFTPVAEWPDARDRSLDALADEAFGEWEDGYDDGLRDGEAVRWLYSGRVAETDPRQLVVAFATCGVDDCSRLVLLHALEKDVGEPDGDDSMSYWVGETRELVAGEPPAPMSTYLFGDGDGNGDRAGRGPTNVLFVLAGPDAARVAWESPARRPRTGGSGELRRLGAVFASDVGYLSAHATITVSDAKGRVRHAGRAGEVGREGEPDEVPFAEQIEGIEVGAGYERMLTTSGQLSERTGFSDQTVDTPYAVFVRCVGDAPMGLDVDGRRYSATCDGVSRRASPVLPRPRDGAIIVELIPSRDPFTVYVVAVGAPR